MVRQYFLREVLACVLITLFTYTAIRKFTDPWPFYNVLRQIPLVQKSAGVFVWLIPSLELIAAMLLVFPSLRRVGYMLSLGLMASFSIYIGVMLFFSSHLPCSCGGFIEQLSWTQHLALNILLTIGSYSGWKNSCCKPVKFKTFFQTT